MSVTVSDDVDFLGRGDAHARVTCMPIGEISAATHHQDGWITTTTTLPFSLEGDASPVTMDLGFGAVDPQDGGVKWALAEDAKPVVTGDWSLPAGTLCVNFKGLLNWKSCQDQQGSGHETPHTFPQKGDATRNKAATGRAALLSPT